MRLYLLVFLSLVLPFCLAQKATITDDTGETVVITKTVDDEGNTDTLWVSTIGTVQTTTKSKSKSTSTSASTLETASITAVPTKVIPAGTIEDYSTYQSSVNSYLASWTSSAWANFTATATQYNFASSSTHTLSSPLALGCLFALTAPVLVILSHC
ncbi:hypothetical protein P7C73_g6858, partial [Tremellales sp. Uapishka_1]